jgi:hypothetical protein
MRRPSPHLLRGVVLLLALVVIGFEFTSAQRRAVTHGTKTTDLSQLITRIETKPASISRVVFDPRALLVTATLPGGDELRANYPSDQSG